MVMYTGAELGEQSRTQSFTVTASEAFLLRVDTKGLVNRVGFHRVMDSEGAAR